MLDSAAMGERRSVAGALAAAMALLAGASAAAAQSWWGMAHVYRRPVTLEATKPTGLAGEEIAVVTMPTGGLTQADAGDIRVASPSGQESPCRVLMTGPGDQVRVAFAHRPGATKYYVYFGLSGQGTLSPRGELDIRRGVLLESWQYTSGPLATIEDVRGILRKAERPLGRDFRDRIFLGHNPFGPEDRLASIFTGWLICPQAGNYVFCSSSQDASFLLVDDKVVVSNGGLHDPQRDVRKTGEVRLDKGLHQVIFYHANSRGDPIAAAAWRPPGEARIVPIPAEAFAPVARAAPGPMERYGQTFTIDFIPQHAGEVFLADRYFQRWQFEALVSGRRGSSMEWEWDFGDGQKVAGEKVQHVYLVPGEYTVRLKASKTLAGDVERVNRIFVSRPWDAVTRNELDALRQHAEIVATYDFAKLPPEAIGYAVALLDQAGDAAGVRRAGRALLERGDVSAASLGTAMTLYANALVAGGQAADAVSSLVQGAKLSKTPSTAAELLVQAGEIALQRVGDAKGAQALFDQVIRDYAALTTSPAIRSAQIGLGDVWRLRGDADHARAAYAAARVQVDSGVGKAAFAKGDYARHVEDYLRSRNFTDAEEFLREWGRAFPLDKMEGYWSLLRVRLFLGQAKLPEAVQEAETLVGVNPASNYAPELLLEAAGTYEKLGRGEDAAKALKRIVLEHPESPLAAQAAAKLKGKG